MQYKAASTISNLAKRSEEPGDLLPRKQTGPTLYFPLALLGNLTILISCIVDKHQTKRNNFSNTSLQKKVVEESEMFGDLLQSPFVDSYNNLTLKSLFILKYFAQSTYRTLLKTDDDSYINLSEFICQLASIIQNKVIKRH